MPNNGNQDAVMLERTYAAPASRLWSMWTEPEHFKQWYGPQGFTVPVAEFDLRVGGRRVVCMASPDGSRQMWTAGEHRELQPNLRLVYTESPADERGQPVDPSTMGMPPGYPATTEVTVALAEANGRTRLVLTHAGIPAGSGAEGGWSQALEKLERYLETADEGISGWPKRG